MLKGDCSDIVVKDASRGKPLWATVVIGPRDPMYALVKVQKLMTGCKRAALLRNKEYTERSLFSVKKPTYVRLLVTMRNGRSFALPPLPSDQAKKYRADLLRYGRKEYDRDGSVIYTPPEVFVAFEYIPCDMPTSHDKGGVRAA